MTLNGGIHHPTPLLCQGPDCYRDPDAKCDHCGRHFCGQHIVQHLQSAHQIYTGGIVETLLERRPT